MLPASDQQKRFFFLLVNKLGYGAEDLKERTKKRFNLTSFDDITRSQLSEVINILIERAKKKNLYSTEPCPRCGRPTTSEILDFNRSYTVNDARVCSACRHALNLEERARIIKGGRS